MNQLAGPIARFAAALGSEIASPTISELIKQLNSPFDISFGDGSMNYNFNRAGVVLVFASQVLAEALVFTQAKLTSVPADTFLPFPMAPINGLAADASRDQVLATFGQPTEEAAEWAVYQFDDSQLWFRFDQDDKTRALTVTGRPQTADPAAPSRSANQDATPAETATQLDGVHKIDHESQTVVFTADGLLLSFVHMFVNPYVITQYNGRFWTGGIIATRLAGNQISIQLSPEAAAELGLPTTFEFDVRPEVAQDCYQGLEQMLAATADREPTETPASEPATSTLQGPIADFVKALGVPINSKPIERLNQAMGHFVPNGYGDQLYHSFYQRGLELLFENQKLAAVFFYPAGKPAGETDPAFEPFPVPLLEGLPREASEAELRASFGVPIDARTQWLYYRLDGAHVWFNLNPARQMDTLTVATRNIFAELIAEQDTAR